MIFLKNFNLVILLLLLIIVGIFIGIIISICTNSTSKDFLVQNNDSSTSENLINNINISGEFLISDNRPNEVENLNTGDSSQNTQITDVLNNKKLNPSEIKAIYLTGWSAGTKSKRQSVIENLNKYGFNAVVIDIKDEAGHISYPSNVQVAVDISASKKMISDIEAVLEEFHNSNIYVIGRIVTFKDPTYAKNITSNAYKVADGSLWKDYSGNYWPNPYNTASWEYPILLAKEAAELGFDEIQFDYVRFPSSEGKVKNIVYGFDADTKTKSEIINDFLKYAVSELKDYDVVVSADVFGITTKKRGDFEHIGQDFYEIAKIVDVVCPMIYPSHYGYGEYGINAPDTQPYKIVKFALQDAQKQYHSESGDMNFAKIRPYLQDFTASWLKKGNYIFYDTSAVTAQLQACYELDIHDFTLWDPNNKYAYEALRNVEETKNSTANSN